MKLKKLLESLSELNDADQKVQLDKYKQIKKTLNELKKKCKELEEKVGKETDEERIKELKSKQKIIATQRRKGLELLKELKQLKKAS